MSGGRAKLTFVPEAMPPGMQRVSLPEAQAMLTALHESFLKERPRIRVIVPPGGAARSAEQAWERRLREEWVSRWGPLVLPLTGSVEQSRLWQALRLSPEYMGQGVQEAARELFRSPVFLASVTLSVLVYFAAWLAPEPVFSKAFAATATVALALVVGVVELTNLAWACLRLYRESEAADSPREMEAAAERFGKAVGGAGLRVLVMVASLGVGKAMPAVPGGWMSAPRYAVEGGVALEAGARVQVIAEGALVVSGVATGEVASRLCGGAALCMTGQAGHGAKLSTRYGPAHTPQNPPHNEAIEKELAAREAAGHTDLRKNKAQVDAEGKPVLNQTSSARPRFRRPDASSLRPDGVRYNTNYVSDPRDLTRELEAFEAMIRADRSAIQELYQLDGTLLRRYVPPGVTFP
ncbi:hypothetical protein POL68_24975 [Stigmatella sp. ncwal1]|uniref:Uncharacterized protein n=1 Tax=Stigmatella ashevillensis TaxID=2995309 RepID=A0ABT5DDM7_9BACT|nr:hypothetical protein [Stigmatella ashevillena]MDC0711746.1 hypothetical protein [Stigmatella ashevillena]